ncbi:MAG TPA: transketolase [Thermoleophilia bacterium]|nr:transketolase [Thermoleophilia bacterium]
MSALPTDAARPALEAAGELARQLRVDSIRSVASAGSGHPTSSLSAADLMAVLFVRHLHYDWSRPDRPDNDHLIFSKGHASPLLYSLYKAVGVVDDRELLETYRRAGSRLQGHPTPALPWVDVATGSLGQGLPDGVGVALAGKRLDRADFRVWVLCGDSEMAEGSMWEALDKASLYELDNLTVIVDVNRLGQTGPTGLEWDLEAYRRRVEAFGCRALVVDGHDLEQIDDALSLAARSQLPTVVLARTVKGKGVPEVEDAVGWHGKPLKEDVAEAAVRALGGVSDHRVETPPRPERPAAAVRERRALALPKYEMGMKVATRAAFGDALAALGAWPEVVAIDGEVGNSTFTEKFRDAHPDRFFQMYIAEQQMIGTAVGMSVRGYIPFAATFAAFLTRAYDFIRMAAVSGADIRLCGSHAGVEIGQDGPSQMGLEDLAALRAVHGSTVLYPSDATSAAALTATMAELGGVSYLRTTRGAYPVLYPSDEEFPVGGSKLLHASADDRVLLAGAGVTLHTCLAAAEQLRERGIPARVIDLYSVKPLDADGLAAAAREAGRRIVVVEDHYPEGGLGEAVLAALAPLREEFRVEHLAVRGLPGSGTPAELMAAAGIASADIEAAALRLLEG